MRTPPCGASGNCAVMVLTAVVASSVSVSMGDSPSLIDDRSQPRCRESLRLSTPRDHFQGFPTGRPGVRGAGRRDARASPRRAASRRRASTWPRPGTTSPWSLADPGMPRSRRSWSPRPRTRDVDLAARQVHVGVDARGRSVSRQRGQTRLDFFRGGGAPRRRRWGGEAAQLRVALADLLTSARTEPALRAGAAAIRRSTSGPRTRSSVPSSPPHRTPDAPRPRRPAPAPMSRSTGCRGPRRRRGRHTAKSVAMPSPRIARS